jgi:hypothetical protein
LNISTACSRGLIIGLRWFVWGVDLNVTVVVLLGLADEFVALLGGVVLVLKVLAGLLGLSHEVLSKGRVKVPVAKPGWIRLVAECPPIASTSRSDRRRGRRGDTQIGSGRRRGRGREWALAVGVGPGKTPGVGNAVDDLPKRRLSVLRDTDDWAASDRCG